MPLEHFRDLIGAVETDLAASAASEHYRILARLSVDLFALMVWRRGALGQYKTLQRYLVALPPAEVQRRFVGNSGEPLLVPTCAFANHLERMIDKHLRPTEPLSIVDYGCGWGRFTRLLPRMAPIEKIYALDPLPDVQQWFANSLLHDRFRLVERVPAGPPDLRGADVVFLFSVMTHTPPHLTAALAGYIGEMLKPGGLALITIRPKLFWERYASHNDWVPKKQMNEDHDGLGYGFCPHDATGLFGDVSYTAAKICEIFEEFDVVDRTYSVTDPLQVYLTFRKS